MLFHWAFPSDLTRAVSIETTGYIPIQPVQQPTSGTELFLRLRREDRRWNHRSARVPTSYLQAGCRQSRSKDDPLIATVRTRLVTWSLSAGGLAVIRTLAANPLIYIAPSEGTKPIRAHGENSLLSISKLPQHFLRHSISEDGSSDEPSCSKMIISRNRLLLQLRRWRTAER